MSTLRHYPLGARVPDSPHAVCCSLPTMADVRGYEEKDPRVMAALASGYPRFMTHAFVRELVDFYLDREALEGRAGVLIPSRRAVDDLLEFAGGAGLRVEVAEGLFLVHFDPCDERGAGRIRKYVQHTGCGISSRQAEDLLVGLGRLPAVFDETLFRGNAEDEVEARLANLYGCRPAEVLLCASGMTAFYAAFQAVREFQTSRGRGRWLQLGWLYLDSGCVLREFLGEGERLDCAYDLREFADVERLIESCGDELAGVVVEVPTNPLVQVCDLERVARLVRKHGGVLIADPTMASAYNFDILPHTDILVNSLTKYAAIEGDVMIGALALNRESPFYGDLVARTSRFHLPPYRRDLARLAVEMAAAPVSVGRMNRNAAALAAFLAEHPAVARVHFAGSEQSPTFRSLARGPDASGAIVTIELKGPMEAFYDRIRAMKGPSFGTRFTIVSPFLYLAHYDLVTEDKGRAFLKGIGLHPELLRISVGVEPFDAIKAAFAEALDAVPL